MADANSDQPADTALVFRMGLHLGDLIEQTNETLRNLAAVVRAGSVAICDDQYDQHATDADWLQRFRWLRVYFVRQNDRMAIAQMIGDRWSHIEHIEWRQANLCRPELLVEIEGVARQPRIEPVPIIVNHSVRHRAALEV